MWPNSLFAHHLGYHMPSSRRCMLGTCLSVSGPLDFCLLIQVLLSPHMILNACVCRLDLSFTSHPKDVFAVMRCGFEMRYKVYCLIL